MVAARHDDNLEGGPSSAPARVIGRYRVITELARGATSVVYLAARSGPGGQAQLFALKQLRPELAEDSAFVRTFAAAAGLAGRLSHPNLVCTLEHDAHAALPYVVMEYLDGQPLYRFVARARMAGAPLLVHTQLRVLRGVLEGLKYVHSAVDRDGSSLRAVHRDVSPHNVFVTYDGVAKLLDFGIARSVDCGEAPTRAGRGRIAYLSPEQAAGGSVDVRSDLFAAGVMMWEAATGLRFWSGMQGDAQILESLASGSLPPGRESKLWTAPRDLRDVVLKATAVDPASRYQSADALLTDLDAALGRMRGPSADSNTIAGKLDEIFADERARLLATIEAQLEIAGGVARAEDSRGPGAVVVGLPPTRGPILASVAPLMPPPEQAGRPGASPQPVALPPPGETRPATRARGARSIGAVLAEDEQETLPLATARRQRLDASLVAEVWERTQRPSRASLRDSAEPSPPCVSTPTVGDGRGSAGVGNAEGGGASRRQLAAFVAAFVLAMGIVAALGCLVVLRERTFESRRLRPKSSEPLTPPPSAIGGAVVELSPDRAPLSPPAAQAPSE